MGDGLVIVYTGGGKGKTTAALGMALRAAGYGHKTCMVQFIKGSWHYGERDSAAMLGESLELIVAGKGFVGIMDDSSPRKEHVEAARGALRISREKITSDKYETVILDEINYAVDLGLITTEDVLGLIGERPPRLNLVLTGNHARPEIVEAADLVTEMKEVKHPYRSGRRAARGVDF
ncbi:ATP corrinoid adenosyltransferase [Cenarchaeum symbiosum A]|uniref:ATP corrinoid adenosyltransferase n=1 Tax=Cenarchaeum symbiosum (strain A) TaxID=414004 RepID=A0RYY8_CENSY|nr:ATP corrinoid adenosyltransferase [Cenarchaeum symbiosum A]